MKWAEACHFLPSECKTPHSPSLTDLDKVINHLEVIGITISHYRKSQAGVVCLRNMVFGYC